MIPLYHEHPKLVVLLIVIVALGILAGGSLLFLQVQGPPDLTVAPSANDAVVLEGTYVCLPRIDDKKAAECTPGLMTAEGTLYALDLGPVIGAGGDPQLKNGEQIAAGGLVLRIEDISTDQWDLYPVNEIMRVEEVARP